MSRLILETVFHLLAYTSVCMCGGQRNFQQSVPFYSHVVSRLQTQDIRLDGKRLYSLSYLTGPKGYRIDHL